MSDSNKWSTYKLEIYRDRKGPQPLGSVVFEDIEEKAKEALKDYGGAFLYAYGNAGVGHTEKNNRRALERFAIIPRMLVESSRPSLGTTIFGVKLSAPVLVAPIGVQSLFHPEAEFATAQAAKNLGIPIILSTVATRTIEEVAEANGNGHRWFQLYWPRTDDVTLSLLKRARENGYSALVVTLDTQTIGWRPSDLQTSFNPFIHGLGCQIGLSDPAFMGKFSLQPVYGEHPEFPYRPAAMDQLVAAGDEKTKQNSFLGLEWLKEAVSGEFRSWEDLRFLRENWKGPLVLKGIQCAQDAELALDHGVDGIVVSNHGGRQVDGAIPSLYALQNVMKSLKIREAQESGKFTIFFDSGIRTGSDIIKALALGAQAVLLGRPWLYGLIVGGQAGVEQVLKHTIADLETNLSLAGYRSLADIHGKGEKVITKLDF